MSSNITSTNGRADWTASPYAAVEHFQALPDEKRCPLIETFKLMAQGSDGGQIEPWGPSIRSVLYPEWSNDDFRRVVEIFSPRAGARAR